MSSGRFDMDYSLYKTWLKNLVDSTFEMAVQCIELGLADKLNRFNF